MEVASAWGIDEELWDRDWSNLSGGEAQRIALAIAVGLNAAEILLLDGELLTVLRSCYLIIKSNQSRLLRWIPCLRCRWKSTLLMSSIVLNRA